jgi:hypothetical protein
MCEPVRLCSLLAVRQPDRRTAATVGPGGYNGKDKDNLKAQQKAQAHQKGAHAIRGC